MIVRMKSTFIHMGKLVTKIMGWQVFEVYVNATFSCIWFTFSSDLITQFQATMCLLNHCLNIYVYVFKEKKQEKDNMI